MKKDFVFGYGLTLMMVYGCISQLVLLPFQLLVVAFQVFMFTLCLNCFTYLHRYKPKERFDMKWFLTPSYTIKDIKKAIFVRSTGREKGK